MKQALASCFLALSAVVTAAEPIDTVHAYYLGNSFTGNAMPGLHQEAGAGAGKTWTVEANIQPGVPIWVHMNNLLQENQHGKKFIELAPNTDAMVMLIFADPGFGIVKDEMWGGSVDFGREIEISAPNACGILIDRYIELSPGGRAFIYTPWPAIPGMPEVRERIKEEARKTLEQSGASREEVLKQVRERKPTQAEMLPHQLAFDYEKTYLAEPPAVDDYETFSPAGHEHTRGYFYRIMEELKTRFPKLWEEGRLGMVPVGDVFLEIERAARAGKVPGLQAVGEFSADGGHLRAGLPRYTLTAIHYAVLFKEHPGKLSAAVFNDPSNYVSKPGFYVHPHDLGELLIIEPATKRVIDDIIWETVRKHPYTHVDR